VHSWLTQQVRRLPGYAHCKKAFCGNNFIFASWIVASAIVTLGLPASALLEFWQRELPSENNSALELLKIYPHMLLVPPMMQWAVLWVLGSGLSLARVSWAAVGIALLFLGGELVGSPVMLLELSPHSNNANSSWQDLYKEHRSLLTKAVKKESTTPKSFEERQNDLRANLQYEKWRSQRSWSVTRVFYGATFFISMFTVASLYMGLAYAKDLPNDRVRNRFITLLVATAASYALWFPSRFYFNSQIKGVVFGAVEATPGRDVILCLTLAAFGVAALILHWAHIEMVKNVAGVVAAIVAPLAAFFTAPFLGGLIGISSGPFQWAYVFVFIVTTFFLYSRLLAEESVDAGQPKRAGAKRAN
jgi:hypothetical protein